MQIETASESYQQCSYLLWQRVPLRCSAAAGGVQNGAVGLRGEAEGRPANCRAAFANHLAKFQSFPMASQRKVLGIALGLAILT